MKGELLFGLDLGINNVGWAAVRSSKDEIEVYGLGTYLFESPLVEEKDATSGTKTKDRGLKRRARKTLARRSSRKKRLYRLLTEHGFLPKGEKDRTEFLCRHTVNQEQVHPYALRARALDHKLEPYEFGRALCHLNQRRGFLSPRALMLVGVAKFEDNSLAEDDKATGEIKREIRQTRDAMAGFRTVGEFFNQRIQNNEPVRKKTKTADHKDVSKEERARRFVRADRDLIEQEFEKIWDWQAQYHPLLTAQLKEQIHNVIFNQIPIGKQMGLRGKCTFYPEENRIARASMPAQKFEIALRVAQLIVETADCPQGRFLAEDERNNLVAALMETEELTWAQVKKVAGLDGKAAHFNIEPPPGKSKAPGCKETLKGSKTAAAIKEAIPEKWEQLDAQSKAELVSDILTMPDDPKSRLKDGLPFRSAAGRTYDLLKCKSCGPNSVTFTPQEAAALATTSLPAGYLNFSYKAVRKLIPHLLKDCRYDEACTKVGLNHSAPQDDGEIHDRLKPEWANEIAHPLVKCSVLRAIKVINAMLDKYGMPDQIHIELPRDLANSVKRRLEIEDEQKKREQERKVLVSQILEAGGVVNEYNIKKLTLWYEAGKALPYEPNVTIGSVQELLSEEIEIDHIVPRSHNYDNSYGNLTLCTRDFNIRTKKNHCLYKAVTESLGETAWKEIEANVKGMKGMHPSKRNRILAKELPEGGFAGRHFSTTAYISTQVLMMVKKLRKPTVVVINGATTAELRRLWGLNRIVPLHPEEMDADGKPKKGKKARSNYKHHALDALVVALTTVSNLQKVTKYYQQKELSDPDFRLYISAPDKDSRNKVTQAIADAHIVRRPHRKVEGELHKQTALGREDWDERYGPGKPKRGEVRGNKLVKRNQEGEAAQVYLTGSNHHVVIWERTEPNKKGEFERFAEVVSTIEASRRKFAKEPVFRKHRAEPGWRFVMALCKGDTVEMEDGTIGVVSKFYQPNEGNAGITIWHPHVANQIGKINKDNPYLIANIMTANKTRSIRYRITLNIFGDVMFREGGDE